MSGLTVKARAALVLSIIDGEVDMEVADARAFDGDEDLLDAAVLGEVMLTLVSRSSTVWAMQSLAVDRRTWRLRLQQLHAVGTDRH